MKIPFIDLQAQYQAYKPEIQEAINTVLDSGQYIMGDVVRTLETDLQTYTGASYALTCSSGSDAQLLALMAIGIKPGDEVITTPFTFIATASMIAILGAKPVFVDILPNTFHIDPAKIANKITDKTKAIVPVSLFGQVADMDEINILAKEAGAKFGHKIYVIEDAAQSFGAEYFGKKSCNLSDIAYTSFFPSKPLGCYGDGGAVFTNDAALADKISSLRIHGQTQRYHHQYIGINGRIDTLQAAVISTKLKHFSDEVIKRQSIGARYHIKLQSCEHLSLQTLKDDRSSVYAQYSVCAPERAKLLMRLQAAQIPTAIHYPKPLHLQQCFAPLGYQAGDFPIAERVSEEIFSLPMSPFLTQAQQDEIVEVCLQQQKVS